MDRNAVLDYALKRYKTRPEYLWIKYPDYAVLRHSGNQKWYAVVMNVPKERLGLQGPGETDIMDVKCPPELIGSMRMNEGVLPGYHMNKANWISVLLEGSAEEQLVYRLLDLSYEITAGPKKK